MKLNFDCSIIAVIAAEYGPDTILITVDLKEPIYPFRENETSLKILAAQGDGVRWVEEHFGIRLVKMKDFNIYWWSQNDYALG